MGEKFTVVFLNPLHTQTSSVVQILWCCMMIFFFLGCMQCMTYFLERVKVLSSIDGFSLWQKLYQYVLFSDFFWGGGGEDQDNETSCCHPSQCSDKNHCFWQHTVPPVMRKHFLLMFLFLHLQMRKTLGTNFLVCRIFHLIDHIVPCSSLCRHCHDCHMSFFSDGLICFLLCVSQ